MVLTKETIKKIDELVYGITNGFITRAKTDKGIDIEDLNTYANLLTSIGELGGCGNNQTSAVGFVVHEQEDEE